ncbi:178_t:CDS:2, partial [Acaulospora colombiana]
MAANNSEAALPCEGYLRGQSSAAVANKPDLSIAFRGPRALKAKLSHLYLREISYSSWKSSLPSSLDMLSARRPLRDLNTPSKVEQPPGPDKKTGKPRKAVASSSRNKSRPPQIKAKRRPISTMIPKYSSNSQE